MGPSTQQQAVDNIAVVHIINVGTSKNPPLMSLVRSLFFITAGHNIEFRAEYISSAKNDIADALSRGQIDRFRLLAPDADPLPSSPGYVPLTL